VQKGKKELLAIRGMSDTMIDKLSRAGITDTAGLLSADTEKVARDSGIAPAKVKELQAAIKKKKDTAVIQI
jgi:predicted RecB family nuclease